MTEQAKRNKKLRQERNSNHFLEATVRLLEEKGMPDVTIRNIADEAGYSSGSIYKYFDNVEQLVAFAAIRCMHPFLQELSALDPNEGSLEKYFHLIYVSTRHALLHTNVFRAVMISRSIEPGPHFESYYALYPGERVDLPQDIFASFFAPTFSVRTDLLLEQCAAQGLLAVDDIREIVDFTNMLFEGFLYKSPTNSERYNAGYFIQMVKRVFLFFQPNLADRIEKIQEKLEA